MLIFKAMQRWLLKIFFFCFTVFALARVYYLLTDDFRMGNVIFNLPYHAEWNTAVDTENEAKVKDILSQEFYYLAKGAQSYAFTSEDGRYVLKLFKFKHMKPSFFVKMLPSMTMFEHYKADHLKRKKNLLNKLFSGYLIAYEKHRDETGIVYVQLNKTGRFEQPIVLHDKMGLRHTVNPDRVYFVIQEKAVQTETVLRHAMDAGNIELAKKRLNQIFELYQNEYAKGLADADIAVMRNTGFVGERPIHFDVGELMENGFGEPGIKIRDFEIIAEEVDTWFKTNYPKEHPEFVKEIRSAMARVASR